MSQEHRKALWTARGLIRDYAIRSPEDIDIEAIAFDQGVMVTEGPLAGSWARLLRKGPRAILRVSNAIPYRGQRRFCIAHEVGHFLLHEDRSQLAYCSPEDMLRGYARGNEEPEANAFAGELLMPKDLFRAHLDRGRLTLAELATVSDAFATTISATVHRVVDVAVHVCALVRSEAGVLRSFHVGPDFPFRIREMRSRVDARSCAGEFFRDGSLAEQEADVPADAWLADDRLNGRESIREITVAMPRYGSAVSLLWLVPGSDLDHLAAGDT